MLARAHRFHGLGSLTFAYKRGETVRGPNLAIRYIDNQRRETYRVAVVVSKKVAKSAVARNRIRRRIFEAIRLADIPTDCRHDLIVSVYKQTVADISMTELRSQITAQLRRTGIRL